MRRLTLSYLLPLLFCGLLPAQQIQLQGGGPGENVIGKVTAVAADSLTVTPMSGGDPVTVKVSDSTRITKDRQPAKLTDIKPGDTVFARGQLNKNTLSAGMVGVVDPQMVQRLQGGSAARGTFMMGGAGNFNAEDMGKKFIAGEVKAINETRLTIARGDNNQNQDIEVDENTSFKKGRDSITLADIKPGDFVFGPGELKDGTFVAKQLTVGPPVTRMIRRGDAGPANTQQAPPPDPKPAAPAPPEN